MKIIQGIERKIFLKNKIDEKSKRQYMKIKIKINKLIKKTNEI